MREELRIGRVSDSAELDVNFRRAKFRAEVKNLNGTTARDAAFGNATQHPAP